MKTVREIQIHSLRVVGIASFVLLTISGLQSVKGQLSFTIEEGMEEEFAKIIDTSSATLTTHTRVEVWLEGPVWVPSDGGYLLFSAMGSENQVKKLVPPDDLSDFNNPAPGTLYNGNILDAEGRLISAQAGSSGLQIAMTSLEDASFTTLASTSVNGLKFLSPNDLAIKSDGTIWFTDPAFDSGIDAGAEGHESSRGVYRFHPDDGDGTAVRVRPYTTRPNGLCFSPDESILWVADWELRKIDGLRVLENNTIPARDAIVTTLNLPQGGGNPDGIKCDTDGRVWSSGNGSIFIFTPEGNLIGRINTGFGGNVGNLCFGGPDYKTLYITQQPFVLSIPVKVAGTASLLAGPSTVALEHSVIDGKLVISWPEEESGYSLQETEDVATPNNWEDSVRTPEVADGKNTVEVDPATEGDSKYFQLIQE